MFSITTGAWIGSAFIGSGVYLVAIHFISIYEFRETREQRDLPAIERHVDFPAVRESLNELLKAKLIDEIARRSEGNNWFNLSLGTLGYAIA